MSLPVDNTTDVDPATLTRGDSVAIIDARTREIHEVLTLATTPQGEHVIIIEDYRDEDGRTTSSIVETVVWGHYEDETAARREWADTLIANISGPMGNLVQLRSNYRGEALEQEWRLTRVAEELGASYDAARKMLARAGVKPIGRTPGRGGESIYAAAEVRAAILGRAGRGARTDLT